jgi:hypothetical protein
MLPTCVKLEKIFVIDIWQNKLECLPHGKILQNSEIFVDKDERLQMVLDTVRQHREEKIN